MAKRRDLRETIAKLRKDMAAMKEKGEDTEKLEKELAVLKERLEKEIEGVITSRFKQLKPFKCADDIPNIPNVRKEVYDTVVVPNLIRCGAIPKKDLVVGATYIGDTRNTDKATWDGEKFIYRRCKWGSWFDDECNHFEDDDGYALFVPLKMVGETEK